MNVNEYTSDGEHVILLIAADAPSHSCRDNAQRECYDMRLLQSTIYKEDERVARSQRVRCSRGVQLLASSPYTFTEQRARRACVLSTPYFSTVLT